MIAGQRSTVQARIIGRGGNNEMAHSGNCTLNAMIQEQTKLGPLAVH